MSSKSRIAIQIHWQIYRGWGTSASRFATSSATMSCNSKISIQIHCQIYREVDLPVDLLIHLPIWAQRVKLSFRSIGRSTGGGVDLPVDLSLHLPIWAVTVKLPFTSIHRSTGQWINLPHHLWIWAVRVKLPFIVIGRSTGRWGRSASRSATSSANMSSRRTIAIQILWQIYRRVGYICQ